jgi:hypothetical protein
LNKSRAAALADVHEFTPIARQFNIPVRGAVATAFGCPFEGEVPTQSVLDVIASYHAADRRMPGDRSVLANLAEARTKVLRVTELPPPTALERWTAMWSDVGQFTRSLLATILLWAAVFCALLGRRRIAVIAAVIGVCCAATVALDLVRRDSDTRAVLERPTSLRKGNGDGFELAIAEPLPAGTECRVLEVRPGWVEIECSPTVFGWVKDDTILRVR